MAKKKLSKNDIRKSLGADGPWSVEEEIDGCWSLYYGRGLYSHGIKIIKAPKHDDQMQTYTPTKRQTEFILKALNKAGSL